MVTTITGVSRRLGALIGIGLATGLFSGMFGVGGGVLVVPMLVSFLAFGARPAMATSLAAILFTATAGAAAYAQADTVVWRDAALIGVPAVAGTIGGTWLQQRVHPRRLQLAFSLLLAATAIRLAL